MTVGLGRGSSESKGWPLALALMVAACGGPAPSAPSIATPPVRQATPPPGDGCAGPISNHPTQTTSNLATIEAGACGSCNYPPIGFMPKLPYPSGMSFGLSQSWCCQCNNCLGGGCTSHTGSTSYGLDFSMNGENDCGVHALAVYAGVVSDTRNDVECEDCQEEGFGNYVVVDHGGGMFSRYGHLQFGSVKVSVGEQVCQGQYLGSIGSTGWSTGCHLHFQFEDATGASVPFSKFVETPAMPVCNTTGNPYTSKNAEVTTCGGQVTTCSKVVSGADWVVIDDADPCFQKFNTWYTQTVGYGGGSHFTYSWGGAKTPDTGPNGGQPDSSCTWSLKAQADAQVEIQVFVPKDGATSKQVKYAIEVPGAGTFYKTVDQSVVFDDWAPLGVFPCKMGKTTTVRLNDNTGEPQLEKKIAADAVRARVSGGASCTSQCIEGQSECTSGTAYRICEKGADGCAVWSVSKPCDAGNGCGGSVCQGGSCQAGGSGTACSDGDPCTVGDACVGGQCMGTPLSCDDGNPCTTDTCVMGACESSVVPGACDDGNPCTLGDECSAAGCVGTPMDCSDGNPCTIDGCDLATCTHTPTDSVCDDGDPCTTGDTCASGTCKGEPISCAAWADECNDAVCKDGSCEQSPRPEAPCDDGDPCTTGDVCKSGACVGAAIDCSELSDACNVGVCKGGECQTKPVWVACDDGDPCTYDDFCVSGACVGKKLDCTGLSDICNQGLCHKGACVAAPLVATPCDDGRACTTADACKGGTCAGAVTEPCCTTDWDCNSGDFCAVDKCVTGGACEAKIVKPPSCCHVDTECSTGDPCAPGVCVDHACATGEAPALCCQKDSECDDGIETTWDLCEGHTCKSVPWPGACISDGGCVHPGSCVTVTCQNGLCTAADVEGCCTADSDCDDGVPCTLDACKEGVCVSTSDCCGQDADCDDGDDCTADSCSLGACQHEPSCCKVDEDCNDADPCTVDKCKGTGCVATPVVCTGKECSPDGCCGICAIGAECDPSGACVAAGCAGVGEGGLCDGAILRECVDDVIVSTDCGADGKSCGFSEELGASHCCAPDCAGRTCGDDGCGGTCGSCPAGMRCSEAYVCDVLVLDLSDVTGGTGGGPGDPDAGGSGAPELPGAGPWAPAMDAGDAAPSPPAADEGCGTRGGTSELALGLLLALLVAIRRYGAPSSQ